MTEFRYYCLHDDGRIALGEHVEATDLDAAINHAYEACRSHPTRAYRYVEVWRGAERLYFSPREQGAGRLLPAMRRHERARRFSVSCAASATREQSPAVGPWP
jgi:hypothetical protein